MSNKALYQAKVNKILSSNSRVRADSQDMVIALKALSSFYLRSEPTHATNNNNANTVNNANANATSSTNSQESTSIHHQHFPD